jgi:hypothetical protein
MLVGQPRFAFQPNSKASTARFHQPINSSMVVPSIRELRFTQIGHHFGNAGLLTFRRRCREGEKSM